MKERNLAYFMGLRYDVLLKKVKDTYCAFIPELSLFVEGKSASEAYENLEQKKTQYFKRVLAVDAQDTVIEPLVVTRRKRWKEDLILFGGKTLIVGVIFGIILSVLFPSIDAFINSRINPVKIGGVMIRQVNKKLSGMSESEQENIRIQVRGILQKIKPFVDEVRMVFDDKNNDTLSPHEKQKCPSSGNERYE